jgi:hypothetical protein
VNELTFVGADPVTAAGLVAGGKIGIFLASVVSALAGLALLRVVSGRRSATAHARTS